MADIVEPGDIKMTQAILRHTVLVTCLSLPIFFVCTIIAPTQGAVINLPSSFYVNLTGVLQREDYNFLFVYTNGSTVSTQDVSLNFTLNEKAVNEYNIRLIVKSDSGSFLNETIASATLSEGRLIIDSIPTVLVIRPELLIEGNKLLLAQLPDWNLTGDVGETGIPTTAIENYRIRSVMFSGYATTESASEWLHFTYGYDPSTGILTNAAGSLSDILLYKMGIKLIQGGIFDLESYSQTLNFELLDVPPPGGLWNTGFILFLTLIVGIPVIFTVITVIMYKAHKKSKRKRIKRGVYAQCLLIF